MEDGSFGDSGSYRPWSRCDERLDERCSRMMKCEARVWSCFCWHFHQALDGSLVIGCLFITCWATISSPSDISRQESRGTTHISLHKRHGVCLQPAFDF